MADFADSTVLPAIPKPTSMGRRSFVRGLAVAGAAASSLALGGVVAARAVSAQQRFDHHLQQLALAARELDPTISAHGTQRWNGGLVIYATNDAHLSFGEPICASLALDCFTHVERGPVPAAPERPWRRQPNITPDERYAAMTERENFYRRWLGMPETIA